MKKRTGFTLIELLVVIAIISVLLTILAPSLQKARRQTKSAVCLATLKQWSLCYQLYAQDFKGELPEYIGGTLSTTYMENLREYYSDLNGMRTCPEAEIVSTANPTGLESLSFFGDTFSAWQIDPSVEWLADDDWGIGSYGENSWIRNVRNMGDYYTERCWRNIVAKGESRIEEIPVLMDARWNNLWANDTDPWNNPSSVEDYGLWNWPQIAAVLMRRHRDGINICFLDGSARQVPAEELWNLRWHKSFVRQGRAELSWLK